ncbi:uncharacterized protein LOC122502055 [Leptopilina heterotoma]|uniref:uncharacterized protein LOC122502055 n=1 Tax=Leptopilina heterotoma TaxID=63436 RepID=UPI001CA7CD1C|nr:uncharacterized protein LOC122502055 [Leptopilina heterotoma]
MKFMLCFAVVVLFQMISSAYGSKAQFRECVKELGIPEDKLAEGRKKATNIPELRCLGACLMKKKGELEAGNKMNWDKVRENSVKYFKDNTDKVVQARQECAEQSKAITDECNFVNEMQKCTAVKIKDLRKLIKA